MDLSHFITENLDDILQDWERFAASIPGTGEMDQAALRDHAKLMLETIAQEMSEEREDEERSPYQSPISGNRPGERHAIERLSSGFSIHHIMAEFQALRLSVVSRWVEETEVADKAMLVQLLHFNKGLDRALMESVWRYTKDLDTAREMFLGVIGHDLRSPLAAMKMSAAMLENDIESPARQRRLAARITQSGQRMDKMLTDLMDMARARMGGSMPLKREWTDLRHVATEAVAELKASYPELAIKDRFEGDLRGCWDSERLFQLLINLLTNAVKHGAPNGGVDLHAYERDSGARVEIHNEGSPIPEAIRQSIFDPLVALRRKEKFSVGEAGIGLGLYICKIIVDAHGGGINVSSSETKGTTFCVTLPREEPPDRAEQQSDASEPTRD